MTLSTLVMLPGEQALQSSQSLHDALKKLNKNASESGWKEETETFF